MVTFSLPSGVAAAGWIPFSIIIVLAFFFSLFYIRRFRHRRESEFSSTLTCVLAFAVTLLTSFLLPVDVFLVSFMKTSNGTFKDWAQNSTFRETVEDSILIAYYVLYGLVLAFIFLILPFMYFYYEEKDEESPSTVVQRACTAIKYTVVFILLAAILLILGAFIPMRDNPPTNSTDAEKFQFLINEFTQSRGEDALCFILNVMTLVGMVTMVFYTGSGLSIWPLTMLKGTKSAASEHADVLEQKSRVQERIASIRTKYVDPSKKMSRRDRNQLAELEERMQLMDRQEGHLSSVKSSFGYRCRPLFRPFQIVLGILGALFGFLLWLSLLLSNIDKAIHSLGYKSGYFLPSPVLPNPLDFVLTQSQKYFPLDYILYSLMFLFLVICTVAGIQRLGIWFLFLRMYKIRVSKTRPQALMLLCATVMYTILALNVLVYSTSPQYTTFGDQYYLANGTDLTRCAGNVDSEDLQECLMSRASVLLLRFFYKAWIFGAFYYWTTWVFLGVAVIASVVVLLRERLSSIDGVIDKDDLDESDDEPLIRA